MNILFIHAGIGQFKVLHEYLLQNKLANSWIACSSSIYQKNKDSVKNLIPFSDSGDPKEGYFYTKSFEGRVKRSFGIKQCIQEFLKSNKIDVVVTHGSGGFPLQIFDEFNFPIVPYIEFPSFKEHGHDKRYPQPDYARFVDKIFEMTSYHQVLKSALTIVPSQYSKEMFPECLRERIYVQEEGFLIPKPSAKNRAPGPFRIGFAARDLSSAKGFEDFVQIAKILSVRMPELEFYICGEKNILYSYEGNFLRSINSPPEDKFFDYIIKREGIEIGEKFKYMGFLPYDKYQQFITDMDLFLYPLRHGSLNWGILEMLIRGKMIIASNNCFLPEVIKDGVNGFIRSLDDQEAWVELVISIAKNPERYTGISKNVVNMTNEQFAIENVAKKYLDLFNLAIAKHQAGNRG